MILQAPGGVSPRELFLLGAAAQSRAALTLAAAQEGWGGGAFLFLPHQGFWRT